MKPGDLVQTAGGVIGIVIGVEGGGSQVFVELTKSFYNRTTWTFHEQELRLLNEAR